MFTHAVPETEVSITPSRLVLNRTMIHLTLSTRIILCFIMYYYICPCISRYSPVPTSQMCSSRCSCADAVCTNCKLFLSIFRAGASTLTRAAWVRHALSTSRLLSVVKTGHASVTSTYITVQFVWVLTVVLPSKPRSRRIRGVSYRRSLRALLMRAVVGSQLSSGARP